MLVEDEIALALPVAFGNVTNGLGHGSPLAQWCTEDATTRAPLATVRRSCRRGRRPVDEPPRRVGRAKQWRSSVAWSGDRARRCRTLRPARRRRCARWLP